VAGKADQEDWVRRVLGCDVGTAAKGAPGELKAAQEKWARSRAEALGSLRGLETAIRGMNDPLGDKAIILVKAIAANLTAVPDTKRSVAELRRYIETDSIIGDAELPNGFGIEVKLRAPLAEALAALERSLAA
jgi:hypothetical protein